MWQVEWLQLPEPLSSWYVRWVLSVIFLLRCAVLYHQPEKMAKSKEDLAERQENLERLKKQHGIDWIWGYRNICIIPTGSFCTLQHWAGTPVERILLPPWMERWGHNIEMRKPEPLQIGLNTTVANDELHPWAFAQSLPPHTLVRLSSRIEGGVTFQQE